MLLILIFKVVINHNYDPISDLAFYYFWFNIIKNNSYYSEVNDN